jgi:hypothetical protein
MYHEIDKVHTNEQIFLKEFSQLCRARHVIYYKENITLFELPKALEVADYFLYYLLPTIYDELDSLV